jgi:allantoicase
MSFTDLTDLASRALGGSVVAANDELFAQRENLIRPEAPVHDYSAFGHKGKVYDGWETRRRREPGHDWAIVRLGAPGVVRGVVVDTAFFTGNYPPEISVEAASVEGYPPVSHLETAEWVTIVPRTDARGDTANEYAVAHSGRWTHLRLTIYPDGGVARLRVHGDVLPDPRFLLGTVDLVALENGGRLLDCSDAFYSSPVNLILPGQARIMGDGWENARRRGGGNDFASFALVGRGLLREIEVDTSYFLGNAPGWARVRAADETAGPVDDEASWWDVVPYQAIQPDTRHRFMVGDPTAATHVRLDVYPDGGLARFRCRGELEQDAYSELGRRWWNSLPESHRRSIGDAPDWPGADA